MAEQLLKAQKDIDLLEYWWKQQIEYNWFKIKYRFL